MSDLMYRQEYEADFVTFQGAVYGDRLFNQVLRTDAAIKTLIPEWPDIAFVVLRNTEGFYAALQVLAIKDDKRGDSHDELRFRYAIQSDGSDSFANIGQM